MRIVIDFQGAQSSGSRQRGIGRYTRSITQAIIRNKGDHEVILALNAGFPDTVDAIRAEFDGLLPQKNIRVWFTPSKVSFATQDSYWRRKSAELIREAFLARLEPDVVLVTSLFEGLEDDAVTSIGTLGLSIPTASILYDLIPLIYRQPYLENPLVEAWYETKLDHLRRADLLLAISESSRQEGVKYLGFPEPAAVNVSAAADASFQPRKYSAQQKAKVFGKFGLKRPFVMYTGGIDHRKNIDGLIRAYAGLPGSLLDKHQLVIVCSVQPDERARLGTLAKQAGLKKDQLVLTGFVSESDLLALYNLCELFVFPSWHEGFGLPALEAMSCGRATVGAGVSSVPEVIGREDAMFDPRDEGEITAKIRRVLTDGSFKADLEKFSTKQASKFTWDRSAVEAISALEKLQARKQLKTRFPDAPSRRPKMAYVSPVLPCRSGISDYSAELLPELARHYEIDVIVDQDTVSDRWILANCKTKSVEQFRSFPDCYDRVLYHFGNSEHHQHMFALLEEIPGVVVLHDFYLSGVVEHMDFLGLTPGGWIRELYRSHGYEAVSDCLHADHQRGAAWKYPCNHSVLSAAQGIIVHSENSRGLAARWYPECDFDDWAVIPHLRVPVLGRDKENARKELGIAAGDFMVCSFGTVDLHKLSHRLLEAWFSSKLSAAKNCRLVFVGQNNPGEFGLQMSSAIEDGDSGGRVHITGWVDKDTFQMYLAAADLAVQLRTFSRGETSGAVLDCMNHGLSTIVNANGSMAYLPEDSVCMLPDEFSNEQLVDLLESLWLDADLRVKTGENAQKRIYENHAPRTCANQYMSAIEGFYQEAVGDARFLTEAIARSAPAPAHPEDSLVIADAFAKSVKSRMAPRQLLVDVSELANSDAKTGVQRVVRSILNELLTNSPRGIRVEPVYATPDQGYRYARRFSMGFLDCPTDAVRDEPVEYSFGDIFLGLDLQHHVVLANRDFYRELRLAGVIVQFVIYDLLCISLPGCFVPEMESLHKKWLEAVTESDGVLCISEAVSNELDSWLEKSQRQRSLPLENHWFHLGADIENSLPSSGLPGNYRDILQKIAAYPGFLMVGTIEPRKGHQQALAAFELLWADGVNVNLVIVGKQGWLVDQLAEKLRDHPEAGRKLFWLEGISDEFLQKVYAGSTCLIAASLGEGFGLPLIEAAQNNLDIIARDIPVFREVAGEHAFYFDGTDADSLAGVVKEWLQLRDSNRQPRSESISWITWRESASQLLTALGIEDKDAAGS